MENIASTELLVKAIEDYYNSHVEVRIDQAKIIQQEAANQHGEVWLNDRKKRIKSGMHQLIS